MSLTPNDNLRNRSDYPGDDGINHLELFNKMQEEIEYLRAKLAEADKEISRYIWLRHGGLTPGLRKHIDAAIAKGEE